MVCNNYSTMNPKEKKGSGGKKHTVSGAGQKHSVSSADSSKDRNEELKYIPEAEVKLGPRNFTYTRKISLGNYNPKKQYETEDFSVTHDSFEEAREIVEAVVIARIAELRGVKSFETKE